VRTRPPGSPPGVVSPQDPPPKSPCVRPRLLGGPPVPDSSRISARHLTASLRWLLLLLAPLGVMPLVDCAKVQDNTPSATGGGSGPPNSGGSGGTIHQNTGGVYQPPSACNGMCTDFPTDPIFDTGTSAGDAGSFSGSATDGMMPCITEPQDGSMFPSNWLRARVAFSNSSQVARITLHSDKEANDLVAYTKGASWTIPKDIWSNLASHASDIGNVSITVRIGGNQSTVKFQIAPVQAKGSMVFWSADPAVAGKNQDTCTSKPSSCEADSYLQGFEVGDETTGTVLKLGQVVQKSRTGDGSKENSVSCIGCHSGTPDNAFVTFIDNYDWRAITASVKAPAGTTPSFLAVGGRQAMLQPGWGPLSFADALKAPTLWAAGMRIGVASLGAPDPSMTYYGNEPDSNAAPSLAWINLESMIPGPTNGDASHILASYAPKTGIDSGNSLGIMEISGDPNGGAVFPNFRHDGLEVLYSSTHGALSGRLAINDGKNAPTSRTEHGRPGSTDLYTVPFNMGLGGKATPVMGASSKEFEEYLGTYSPDDQLVSFNRVPAGEVMYANPHAEIMVGKLGGGAPVRIGANDPPACSGKKSPGVNNVWARWSPSVAAAGSMTYYFIIFSSSRGGNSVTVTDNRPSNAGGTGQKLTVPIVQLYITVITIDEQQNITSYPAIYLWNQDPTRLNLTPAWSTFEIPPVG